MSAPDQLLSARQQLTDVGGAPPGSRWLISLPDCAALRAGLGNVSHLYGVVLEESDDPALLGRGPVLLLPGE